MSFKQRIIRRIRRLHGLGHFFSFHYTDEGLRLQHMLIHKNIKGYPRVKDFIEKDITPTKHDLLLTERLLKAYQKSQDDRRKWKIYHVYQARDMWSFHQKRTHSDFFSLLRRGDIPSLAFYLCNMSRMGVTHGVSQGKLEYDRIVLDAVYRKWFSLFILDTLIRLAEATGVLLLEDPEQGNFGVSIFSDIDTIIKKMEKRLKIPITPPRIEGGLFKISTAKGGIHFRDINAIYTSWRCRELLKEVSNPSVCEIGAGLGKVAYYSRLFGIRNYTIIDLPHINVLQGFYVLKALPSVNVKLYGERNDDNNSISILPDWSLKKIEGKQFDLTLNQDSFPEIDKKIVLDYLKKMRITTKKFFLSINQESRNTMMSGNLKQNVVSELVSESKGYEKIYRFPYWMREGYVEELYRVLW